MITSLKFVHQQNKRGKQNKYNRFLDLDKEKTSLKTSAIDMYDSLSKINSLKDIPLVQEHLNL